MIKSKTLLLCADDYGLNSGVSEGILNLVHQERLSAVSCMVNMPDFIPYGKELLLVKNKVKIGLHFNLTEGFFMSCSERKCFTLNQLLLKSHLNFISLSLIAQEFLAQLDQFIQIMKQLPDFIDGHQHVHQFPRVRQVILTLYKQRFNETGVSIRSTWPSIDVPQYSYKAKILGLTGGRALRQQLTQCNIPHNPYFSGVYDFSPEVNYRKLFRKWLSLAPDHTLIMCHPGAGLIPEDPIAKARLKELNYFLSDEFLVDCKEFLFTLL